MNRNTAMPPNRFVDLQLLHSFIAVVDQGGFTAAAEYLHLAQPTVSAHIKRLEKFYGQALLERTKNKPTAVGERLLVHARLLLKQNTIAWQEVNDHRLEGVVRLGIPEDYLNYLPSALADYEARFPDVQLEVHCGLSVDLIDQVNQGRLDLAITTRQPSSPGGTVLRREPMVWVEGVGYNTHQRQPLPLALSKQGVCIFREHALASLKSAAIDWRVAYTSTSLSGLSAAVQSGLALTVLTPSMMLTNMRIVEGLPQLPNIEIALHVASQANDAATAQLALQLRRYIH